MSLSPESLDLEGAVAEEEVLAFRSKALLRLQHEGTVLTEARSRGVEGRGIDLHAACVQHGMQRGLRLGT